MTAALTVERHTRLDLNRAMAWTHPALIRRYGADFDQTLAEGERCFTAFKQFLIVCALADDERVPSRSIDDMWHTALLFSRSYLQFCNEVLGEVVHHEPIEGTADVSGYAAAREDALALFGDLPVAYWPEPGAAELCGSMYVP